MKKSIVLFNGINYRGVTKTILKFSMHQRIRLFLLGLLLLHFTIGFSSCTKNEKAVLDAYQLRINGKVDSAKVLLQNLIKEDSTNAMAYYELARTLNYMNIMGSEEATDALISAKKYDPENIIYTYAYAKNCFFEAFKAMQTGRGDVKALLDKTCDEFDNVLKMKPEYPEALMYLVEIYGMLPEEMGGNRTKAEEFTRRLEKEDKFYGAKAHLVMMPEGTDMIEYWKNYCAQNGENCNALKELGVAALFSDDVETAKNSFKKAMALDPAQNIRLLDLSRYHQMKVMQDRDAAAKELPKAKEYIDQYLSSKPEPIPPLKAYALATKAKIEMFLGDKTESQKLTEEAKAIDPYFSRAFGIPSLALFEPPTEEEHFFQSFFSPF